MEINYKDYRLKNLKKINILLGKNGTGKSTLLTQFEENISQEENFQVKYITPERAGILKFEPNVESNIQHRETWLAEDRRKNQTVNFKAQSIFQYRKLQLLYFKELDQNMEQRKNEDHTFEKIILGKINSLLENIEIRANTIAIEAFKKGTDDKIDIGKISSGESELISLAIEVLSFSKEIDQKKNNYLLLDEPDVHLHPDLQFKLGVFLKEVIEENNLNLIIATHSTAFMGAFSDYEDASFGLILPGYKEIDFKNINSVYKRILPVFGAHPLSNLFNQSPIFLVEGEDDLRIWQQAIRSSQGKLKIYPVDIDGIDQFANYEQSVREIIQSVYDNPVAFSLRDRDDIAEEDEITDLPPLIRFRLKCRAAENLILSDEVLESLGISWHKLKDQFDLWIKNRTDHPRHSDMKAFQDSGYDRKIFNLKKIRNIIIGETGSSKPWEVAVGQVIGKLVDKKIDIDYSENKISGFLGEKLIRVIINP